MRDAQIEELLRWLFGRQTPKGDEASVGEFNDGRMDARDARAAVATANTVFLFHGAMLELADETPLRG